MWSECRKVLPGQVIRIRLKIVKRCFLFLDIFSSVKIYFSACFSLSGSRSMSDAITSRELEKRGELFWDSRCCLGAWVSGRRDSLLAECRTRDQKRLRVRVPAGAAGEFSPAFAFDSDSYSTSVPPPVLTQWHVQNPSHSAKSAGGRLYLNTLTPLTQNRRSGLAMLSKPSVGTRQGNELKRISSGNTRPQLSYHSMPLWD